MIDTTKPLVSVIIPTYNRAAIIEPTLNSVLNQVYSNWECLIIDDFSTDDTKNIVERYIAQDQRFRYLLNQRKKGAQGARNTGILAAKGEWIAFLDSDDVWVSEKLAMQIEVLESNQCRYDIVVHGDCIVFDTQNNTKTLFGVPAYRGKCYRELLTQPGPVFQALLVSKKNLFDIGLLDEDVPSFQEWDTSIRLARNSEFFFIGKPLFYYYKHTGVTISKDMSRDIKGYWYITQKHKLEIERVLGNGAYQMQVRKSMIRAMDKGLWDEAKLHYPELGASWIDKQLCWLCTFKVRPSIIARWHPSRVLKRVARIFSRYGGKS